VKVVTIVGARPQFIKAAAVSRTLRQCCQEILVHTGQHYDANMSEVFFEELDIPAPEYNLGIGSGTHGEQTAAMLSAIERVLMEERPDVILVYGDTNSTLAGALAGAKLHIPIAHVEAGLRSFNRRMPEEINRVLTDHMSDHLLCPSGTAVENLAKEGITRGVVVTGDVMADALTFAADRARTRSSVLADLGLTPGKFALATLHRAENTDDPARLKSILSAFAGINETVIFPVHPRTRAVMRMQGIGESDHRNLRLIDPVGYLDMVRLTESARIVLTDSGGLQKEAYWLSTPCITLRDETEWVETVEYGWNILVGANSERIVNAARSFAPPGEHPPLYGDGKAAVLVTASLQR
jgi:UDP-N-acetylglucosamine 2-epimerase